MQPLSTTRRHAAGKEHQMKIVMLTLLAATAAVAATAFIGASSASATPPWLGWCIVPQLLNCTKENLVKHPLLGRVLTEAGPGKFNAGFVTVECESGMGTSNEIEAEQEKEFKGTLESLTFSGCKGCTGVAVKTPQAVVLNMETETGGWRLKANGSKVKFTGCPLSQSCTYEGNLNLEGQMDETSMFVEPKGAEFKKVSAESTSLCAETGKWETGKTRTKWILDNPPTDTTHNVWMSLIGANLIKTF
jgi:hypothetical protein